MTVAGLIFSNIHDSKMPEFTQTRTMASVPFGCRYRLIDFPLSNMVNAGITKVGIITHNNYQSLVDHIGAGKDWDLARRSGGIKILPPFITAFDSKMQNNLYNNRLEALIGVTHFISRCTEDVLVLSDCDGICNIDLKALLRKHERSGAVMTIVSAKQNFDNECTPKDVYRIVSDENGNITSVGKGVSDEEGRICTNIMVVDRRFLLAKINEAATRNYNDFYRDIVNRNLGKYPIKEYTYDGQYVLISSLRSYFAASMKMLDPETREDLLGDRNRPIYTKVRNTSPTVYAKGAKVKNSYIADGCRIEGEVENCIFFRGVHIGKGSVVKNCILLQDTKVGEKVSLNCTVADKNVKVRDGRTLSGHETIPFFLAKGTEV